MKMEKRIKRALKEKVRIKQFISNEFKVSSEVIKVYKL